MLLGAFTRNLRQLVTVLTVDELLLLELLAEGRDTRQIARAMSWSESTVKRAIRSLQQKLGARNRAQAVHLATKHGVI